MDTLGGETQGGVVESHEHVGKHGVSKWVLHLFVLLDQTVNLADVAVQEGGKLHTVILVDHRNRFGAEGELIVDHKEGDKSQTLEAGLAAAEAMAAEGAFLPAVAIFTMAAAMRASMAKALTATEPPTSSFL